MREMNSFIVGGVFPSSFTSYGKSIWVRGKSKRIVSGYSVAILGRSVNVIRTEHIASGIPPPPSSLALALLRRIRIERINMVDLMNNVLKSLERARNIGDYRVELVSLISVVDEIYTRYDVSGLEESIIALRELIEEAIILQLQRKGKEAREALDRAAELARMVRELLRLKAQGVKIVRRSDLVKVGEIAGRPVYALRRNSLDKRES